MTMCDKCIDQEKARRNDAPHSDLEPVGQIQSTKTMFGYITEQDYKCRVCGQAWTHETGSYGCGWIK